MYTNVLIFGTFDGLHDGHKTYIEEAYRLGEHVTVSITPGETILTLKGYKPRYTEEERSALLRAIFPSLEIVLGDTDIASWNILETVRPDAIVLGYDQEELAQSIIKSTYVERNKTPILRARAHRPDTHHNSLLHNQQ
jgi:cytidyltransferase-like protein